MALVLNEEQTMLRDAARDFLSSRAPVSHHRQLRDDSETSGFSRDLWAEMADMGWSAIIIPEEYGGLDYGYTGLGLVIEESGRTLTPSPLISTALLGTVALILSGNKEMCGFVQRAANCPDSSRFGTGRIGTRMDDDIRNA